MRPSLPGSLALLLLTLVLPARAADEAFAACEASGTAGLCAVDGTKALKAGNIERGLRLLRGACSYNNVLGCAQLGLSAIERKDWDEAVWALKRACDQGEAESCKILPRLGRKSAAGFQPQPNRMLEPAALSGP